MTRFPKLSRRKLRLAIRITVSYKQRLQLLFFPEGIAYDGNRFNRTAVTAPLFNYLTPDEGADERVVSRVGIEPTTRRLRVASGKQNARARRSELLC